MLVGLVKVGVEILSNVLAGFGFGSKDIEGRFETKWVDSMKGFVDKEDWEHIARFYILWSDILDFRNQEEGGVPVHDAKNWQLRRVKTEGGGGGTRT